MREGISAETFEGLTSIVDIIEVFNSRTLEPATRSLALAFAKKHKLAVASASDAHGYRAIGNAYSILSKMPTRENLVELLQKGDLEKEAAGILARLTPKLNKLKKLLT